MQRKLLRRFVLAAVPAVLGPAASAQLGEPWVTFSEQPAKLAVAPLDLCEADTQVAFRAADMDQDTWDDVVAVRKQAASQLGKRAAFLLMNEEGVLTDRTAVYASASDVPLDLGFLTPCNNQECVIGDVNGDGWLDVVTAVTLSDGDPKHLSHPRVYVNLGEDGAGAWLGLRHEDARVPQLLTVSGLAVAPRFAGVDLGDLNGDGAPELYFTDHDITQTNKPEPAGWDLNDRLLVNDGNGYFTDGSSALTATQLNSYFGADVQIIDLNVDGLLDILKVTADGNPTAVRILYNDPDHVGNFTAMGVHDVVATNAPFGAAAGNLSNDAIADIAVVSDGTDRYCLGTGYDSANELLFGPPKMYTFQFGGDDGFGNRVYLRDLDVDGWNDVLITDVSIDFPGCSRRLHIYHNTGSLPGDPNLVLKEEVELASATLGWKGAVGLTVPDIKGTHDVCCCDFDKDGDLDLLLGNCGQGAQYFQNETDPNEITCQTDVGFAGPGDLSFSLCGDDLTEPGGVATMELSGAATNAPLFIPLSLTAGPVPLKGGQLVPFPVLALAAGLTTDGAGGFSVPVSAIPGAPMHVYMQCIVKNGAVFEFSNGLDAVFGF